MPHFHCSSLLIHGYGDVAAWITEDLDLGSWVEENSRPERCPNLDQLHIKHVFAAPRVEFSEFSWILLGLPKNMCAIPLRNTRKPVARDPCSATRRNLQSLLSLDHRGTVGAHPSKTHTLQNID